MVSRLERIEADLALKHQLPCDTQFFGAGRNGRRAQSGPERWQLRQGQYCRAGGSQRADGGNRALSGIFQGDEIRVTRRFTDFSSGDAILPNDVLLFSDAQYRGNPGAHSGEPQPPAPLDRSAEMEWSPVWSLRDERFKYLPTGLLYFFYKGPGQINADSNGCAAGNTLEEAIVQGFLELVERDAYAIWWYNRLRRPEVDLGQFDDSYVRDLQTQLAETGRRLWVLDVTSDLGVPTYVAITHGCKMGRKISSLVLERILIPE